MFGIYSNIRILDVSRILVGPYATMMLSDLGAEVLKVESFEGDETRNWGPPFLGTTSTYFLSLNRGKQSVAINLKEKRGQELFQRLAEVSDVVVENFNIGVTQRLNIDYKTLSTINPRLIYASVNGYGPIGPQSTLSGFDLLVQASTGLMSITGEKDGPPIKVGFAVADVLTASQICIAIQAALFRRTTTGTGCHIQTSLYESMTASLLNVTSSYLNGQHEQNRMGNMHASIVPYGSYMVGQDEMMLGSATNGQFMTLCQVIRRPELIEDDRFSNNSARVFNRQVLKQILEESFSSFDINELCQLLNDAKVPCSKIKSIAESLESPQAQALQLVKTISTQNYGDVDMVRSPLWFNGEKQEEFIQPPLLNQHRNQVMKLVGIEADEIQQLIDQGVLLADL